MSREGRDHSHLAETTSAQAHVLLVGSNHQENLALQYLAASLERAGCSVDVIGFNDRSDAVFILSRLRERPAMLVGIQIAFQYTVEDSLWLARAMRADGYRGHMTAGGHVATFCYRELLEDDTPLDSVVRHEGEQTLVELAQALNAKQPVSGIPGCVTRAPDGWRVAQTRPLERNLDTLPPPRRPAKPHLVAGVPIAFLLTSRGCHGDCNYCCINAFTRDAGGPAYRLRRAAAVADELMQLAERGVRVVFVQDDLFILPSERAALTRFAELSKELERGQTPPLAFWIKGRPESVTRPVLQAAREFGVIQLFLGIENASSARLKYLGRTHRPEDAEHALQLCAEEGIHPSFNCMLFDPETTLDDVEQNLDFLERHVDLPWNLCRTEVYPGTHLFERLRGEDRLVGDYRSWGYRMRHPETELLFRIIRVGLHERALATLSLHNHLISLASAWQVHLHLFPDQTTRTIAEESRALARAVRQDTIDALRRALHWVKEHARDAHLSPRVTEFAVAEGRAAGQRDFPRHQQVERLRGLLDARGQHLTATRRAPARPCRPETYTAG